ncbi:MAG: molybdenum cofactor guanylyltransferase [Pseudomonadota bacterium]
MSIPDRTALPDLPCVILAGGESRRFGSNKAFASFQGARLIDTLIERMRHQTSGTIAINAPHEDGFNAMNLPLISDHLTGSLGPLAGLHVAMNWAKQAGHSAVYTTPVDTPVLPSDFVERLVATGAPAIAKCNNRLHYVHGLWPTALTDQLESAIERGMRSARDWAVECKAVECEFHMRSGLDPFFNVNTPDDLLTLENAQPDSPR